MFRHLEQFDKIFRYAAVVSYVVMAAQNFRLWAFPQPDDQESILTHSMLMAFEFVMVHSGLFMIIFSGSKKWFLILFVFYGVFAVAFNFAMPNTAIVYTYLFVVLNRFRFIFYEADKKAKFNMIIYSASVVVLYFVLTILFAGLADAIPPLGLSHQFLTDNYYFNDIHMSGLFVEKPHVGIALSVFYFTALALIELRVIRNDGKLFGSKQVN